LVIVYIFILPNFRSSQNINSTNRYKREITIGIRYLDLSLALCFCQFINVLYVRVMNWVYFIFSLSNAQCFYSDNCLQVSVYKVSLYFTDFTTIRELNYLAGRSLLNWWHLLRWVIPLILLYLLYDSLVMPLVLLLFGFLVKVGTFAYNFGQYVQYYLGKHIEV
jgi:hypothetical protein